MFQQGTHSADGKNENGFCSHQFRQEEKLHFAAYDT